MIAMMSTGNLAYVPEDTKVGQEIEIWEIVSGRRYKATIVGSKQHSWTQANIDRHRTI